MPALAEINLIHMFDFYLAVAFMAGSYLRVNQYRSILTLVRAVPGRWPNLFGLVKQHATVFLTWSTVLRAELVLRLSVVHMLACRHVWRQECMATVVLGRERVAFAVLRLGAVMLGVGVYATFWFDEVDRSLLEKYSDQVEYWLRSWTAPV